jgi:hypothetical protein
MNRRSFIAAVGSVAAAGGASTPPASGRGLQARAMISSYVTSIPAIAAPAPGDALQLRTDGKRGYDRHAVEILTRKGEQIGYLPPIHSRIIGPLLTAGFTATAWVEDARIAPRPAIKIGVAFSPSLQELDAHVG